MADLFDFTADFVAGNESQRQRGRVGDSGKAIGYLQYDAPSGSLGGFVQAQPPDIQASLVPDPKRREAMLRGGPEAIPTPDEAQRISKYMQTDPGHFAELDMFKLNYYAPAYSQARRYQGREPDRAMVALMADAAHQRGYDYVRDNVLPRLGPPGMVPVGPSQFVQAEMDTLDTRGNPYGSAIILARRTLGAYDLDVDVEPGRVYTRIFQIMSSPEFPKLSVEKQQSAAKRLGTLLAKTRERYNTDIRGGHPHLKVLESMLPKYIDPVAKLESLGDD